jgi:hypothetical protein
MASAYIRAVPTVDLPPDELAAVAAAIRRLIEDDKYPHAPRLDPLRAALARLDAASKPKREQISSKSSPKAPPPAKADKPARR